MENATNIAKSLHKYPQLKNFLEILLRNIDIETKEVGQKFDYPTGIINNKLHSNYGTFMDYFIRKHLSNQYQIQLTDDVTELVLKEPDTYFRSGRAKDGTKLQEVISKHYEIFKDSNKQAMDILKSIKLVSLMYKLSFHDPLPKAEIESDNENLHEIIKYFKNLPYSKVEMKAPTNCEYFNGNADLIFDQKVLYEIKTSKYPSISRNHDNMKVIFYKLILYAFGYYKKTGKIIKCFKIYNPLLGQEHTLKLDEIDMEDFERVLSKK